VLQKKTAVPKRQKLPSNTTYHEGVPENFGDGGGGEERIVILDGLLKELYSK